MLKLNLSTTLAAALTYFLNFNLGLGPFTASALVGLVAFLAVFLSQMKPELMERKRT